MNSYFDHFIEFWLPIYKRQVFKAKFENNTNELLSIKENIFKNWNLDKIEKEYLYKELGIKFVEVRWKYIRYTKAKKK